jgi:ATP-dependent helicase/nuclease subunit B
VIDYKSSFKKVDSILLHEGIQLQLPVYLNLLKHLPNCREVFGVDRLVPAGVFYINLKGAYTVASTRTEAIGARVESNKAAYQHQGLFSSQFLTQLDSRQADTGDQFNYRRRKKGGLHKGSHGRQAIEFERMLERAAEQVVQFGRQIYAGDVRIDPYRRGKLDACQQCDFKSICRIDPWDHRFRVLQ